MTDAEEITALDERTVERIAAGEVVERPASVVKELVENALDAGAGRVEVAVERGGKDLVRVRDDGEGMTEAAVRKAVRQHTTSKIEEARDLAAGVSTLGFRGEALHTIAAVSKLTIRTRSRGGDAGTELGIEGGDVVAVERVGCPEGTTVEVTDLFYNTPARERYLKQDATEFGRVNDVVSKYALARPDVAVSLTDDGREVFATTGEGDRLGAVLAVYGREVAENMIPVEAAPGGPVEAVEGYVSHPETTRSSRDYVAAFVGGRYVQSAAAREAIVGAYGGQLAADRYPFAVIDISVPGDAVDVNVHPRKMEVRWSEEDAIRRQVEAAVADALREEGLLRSSAPRGRSSPEQTEIEPASPEDREADAPSEETADPTPGDAADGDAGGRDPTGPAATPPGGSSATGVGSDREPSAADVEGGREPPATGTDDGRNPSPTDAEPTPSEPSGSSGPPESPEQSGAAGVRGPDGQATLGGRDATPATEYESLPSLRVLGQLHDTYVVAEAEDGLVLIDQHAADERINYERLRERFGEDAATQALAEPVEVELTAGEATAADLAGDALERLGFRAERVGERTLRVEGLPAVVADGAGPELVRDVLADLVRDGRAAGESVASVADDLLADLACHPSVTGNTSLTEGSVVGLLSALDDCENPWACPHGRPVLVQFDAAEIDDRFERDYPGHDHRRR